MTFPRTLSILPGILILLVTAAYGQVRSNQTPAPPGRTRALAENARAIDSFQIISKTGATDQRSVAPIRPTGARLIRTGNNEKAVPQNGEQLGRGSTIASRTNSVCYTISGRNFLRQDSITLYSGDPTVCADGNIIVSGEYYLYAPPNYEDGGFCMKTDADGNVIWAKLYDSTADVSFDFINYFKAIELANGSILLAGRTNNNYSGNDDFLLTLLDNNGNTIWLKSYESKFWQGFHGSGDYFNLVDMEEDPSSGDIYFTSGHWGGVTTVTKVSPADGHIIWSNGYDGFGGEQPFGLVINSDKLLLFDLINGSWNDSYVHVTALDKLNGDTLFTKTYSQTGDLYAARLYRGAQVIKLQNGHYRMWGPTTRYFEFPSYTGTIDLFHAGLIELDENLNFIKAWGFKNRLESNGYNTKISLFPDGTGVFHMFDYISGYTGESQVCLFRDDLIYHNRKRFHYNEGMPYEPPTLQLPGGTYLNIKLMGDSLSTTSEARLDYYRISTSDTSSMCIGIKDSSTSLWRFNFEPVSRRIDSIHRNVMRESRFKQFDAYDFSLTTGPACVVTSNCDTLFLSSSASTICEDNTVIITVHKNRGCGSFVPLVYDQNAIDQVNRLSDTTYEFHFNAAGNYYIHGSLLGCELMKDSILITVTPARHSLDLGADTILCPGNQVVLNAGEGFSSYLWQDGSADSTFTVTAIGTYHVTAINSCGNPYADTIIVSDHPPIPLDIGADQSKCNNDSLQINAPSGFITYSWSPNYQLSSSTSQTIYVNPSIDTTYYLKAELTPGCFAFDSVRINVFHSPPINLGNDTSFCQGESIVLNSGTGFSQYTWSNGGNTQQITVTTPGIYFVEAMTSDGCKSFDSLTVINVFANPIVNLNQDSTLCAGTTRLLDAGSPFVSYIWNTGSASQSIPVSGVGNYSVIVVDNNGCYGSGSTFINTLLPVPGQFLSIDTAICSYGSLLLKPMSDFASYQWNTGSSSNSINVTQPGTYWLQVIDNNNCTGRDSVLVKPKECLKGFYIPNAFSPNRDGKNDRFMPLIFGDITHYRFSVYNRWGQIVFSSSLPGQGWDGKTGGVDGDTNVFAWVCQYQLQGEDKKTEKGTVLLIR